ncbi:MAG: hypothetical protein QW728_06530, partial [Thermoplasmata archaeon]
VLTLPANNTRPSTYVNLSAYSTIDPAANDTFSYFILLETDREESADVFSAILLVYIAAIVMIIIIVFFLKPRAPKKTPSRMQAKGFKSISDDLAVARMRKQNYSAKEEKISTASGGPSESSDFSEKVSEPADKAEK